MNKIKLKKKLSQLTEEEFELYIRAIVNDEIRQYIYNHHNPFVCKTTGQSYNMPTPNFPDNTIIC